ncbi:hypothetical protein [Pedobacter sp. MC2016-24]|uniref:hypothetical protein n=1 Tax=Pedobacter sp. MC2016-24 TaxID=2780090 RepID=UPI001881E5A4|nr:hypothetical protein [Pedobacter sp. MC2016-24]MBE9597810.1 hypothetical protein [Pedobacter sp. MC2016-24]
MGIKQLSISAMLMMLLPIFSLGQKAYEAIPYKGMMGHSEVRLIFADGYIGASSITLLKSNRKIKFLPDVGYVDSSKTLKFYRPLPTGTNSPDYFTLINLTEYYDKLPKSIEGSYFKDGKISKVKFFKQ